MSGAHSGGLSTTVFPAASAGATRHVASISGAFHGVITAVTPAGSHETRSANPLKSTSGSPSSSRRSAKNRKLRATRGITEFRMDRTSDPLSRVSTSREVGHTGIHSVGDRVQHGRALDGRQ